MSKINSLPTLFIYVGPYCANIQYASPEPIPLEMHAQTAESLNILKYGTRSAFSGLPLWSLAAVKSEASFREIKGDWDGLFR